jgi:NAD(P)-dependent dehydrogenase (short-subunit alcohol dehydrogenase family)
MAQLSGKVALVTGAAKGIGAACAEALGRAGARVLLSDADGGALNAAVERLSAEGLEVVGARCDVRSSADVAAAVAKAQQQFGGLDICVANAGEEPVRRGLAKRSDAPHRPPALPPPPPAAGTALPPPPPPAGIVRAAPFLEMTETDFDDVIQVNLKVRAPRQAARQGAPPTGELARQPRSQTPRLAGRVHHMPGCRARHGGRRARGLHHLHVQRQRCHGHPNNRILQRRQRRAAPWPPVSFPLSVRVCIGLSHGTVQLLSLPCEGRAEGLPPPGCALAVRCPLALRLLECTHERARTTPLHQVASTT